jgi:hypothetical protein
MSRVREFTRTTALFVALALCFGTSCIFSPEAGEIPPSPPRKIEKPSDLIDALSDAYQQRNPELFAKLLANDPENHAEYLFLLSDPTPENETQWGYTEEVRIHQRMFRPESPLPGDTPVPPEIWLQSLTITLTPVGGFTERTDLYTTSEGGYLDPAKWRATAAKYTTYLLFELAGDTDYRVEGEASFIVIEDRTKDVGDDGKFLLLIWEDLGSTAPTKPAAHDPA